MSRFPARLSQADVGRQALLCRTPTLIRRAFFFRAGFVLRHPLPLPSLPPCWCWLAPTFIPRLPARLGAAESGRQAPFCRTPPLNHHACLSPAGFVLRHPLQKSLS